MTINPVEIWRRRARDLTISGLEKQIAKLAPRSEQYRAYKSVLNEKNRYKRRKAARDKKSEK